MSIEAYLESARKRREKLVLDNALSSTNRIRNIKKEWSDFMFSVKNLVGPVLFDRVVFPFIGEPTRETKTEEDLVLLGGKNLEKNIVLKFYRVIGSNHWGIRRIVYNDKFYYFGDLDQVFLMAWEDDDGD